MLFKYSDINIANIRKQLYPLTENFFMKGALIKTSGTDTLVELSIDVKDKVFPPDTYNQKQLPTSKVYNNIKIKNTLKFKIFQIIDQNMNDSLRNTVQISDIERIINTYGADSYDVFPCVDYKGATVGINNNQQTNDVVLNYKFNFTFPQKDIKFLSFGMIFYFDIKDFIQLKNIPEKYVVKQLLSSDLKIVNLFDSNGNTISGIVQDLRTINKTFKNAEVLDEINEKIFFNLKTTKILSNNKKSIPNDQFFSNLYASRDTYGNLNLLFNMDYKKIIQKYSNFSKIIFDTPFPDDLNIKCKIASLKIVRRHMYYDKNNIKKPRIKILPVEFVISTSQKNDSSDFGLQQTSTDIALIRENNLFDNFRTIEVVDKTAYKNKTAIYQYGVELTVSDGYYQYLSDQRDTLQQEIKVLKEYLLETQKYINRYTKDRNQGYYDPVTESFTQEFANKIFPINYENRIKKSITALFASMKTFGFLNINNKLRALTVQDVKNNSVTNQINQQQYEDNVISSLVSLVKPEFANNNTISYLIHIYEKFINQINRIIKDVSNTTFNIEYWFEDKNIDMSEVPSIGYGFFDINKTFAGMARVTNSDLEKKSAKDIFEYIKQNSLDSEKQNLKYASVGPEYINSKGMNMSVKYIRDIIDDVFMDLELDIKRYIGLGDEEKQAFIQESIKFSPNQQATITKTDYLLSRYSTAIANLYNNLPDTYKTRLYGSEVNQQLNEKINPTMLFLAMLKNVSHKSSVWQYNSAANRADISMLANAPYQISALLKKQDSFFADNNIDYIKNLKSNSRFLLLFNTIHTIEILLPDNNVKKNDWLLLSTDVYNSLTTNKKYLCRLKNYKNQSFNIKFFDSIKLPIYDEYFILDLNATAKEIDDLRIKLKDTYDFEMLRVQQKIEFARFAAEEEQRLIRENEAEKFRLEQERLARQQTGVATVQVTAAGGGFTGNTIVQPDFGNVKPTTALNPNLSFGSGSMSGSISGSSQSSSGLAAPAGYSPMSPQVSLTRDTPPPAAAPPPAPGTSTTPIYTEYAGIPGTSAVTTPPAYTAPPAAAAAATGYAASPLKFITSVTSLSFTAERASLSKPNQEFTIKEQYGRAFNTPVAIVSSNISSWLTAKVIGTAAPYKIQVEANTKNLAVGTYNGTLLLKVITPISNREPKIDSITLNIKTTITEPPKTTTTSGGGSNNRPTGGRSTVAQ